MTILSCLGLGFRKALRHPGLAALAWLAPLLPAIALVWIAAPGMGRSFDHSLYAERILDGRWIDPLQSFLASPENLLAGFLGPGLMLAFISGMAVQVVLAAGALEILLERSDAGPTPFMSGIGRNGSRFARSAFWMLLSIGAVAIVVGVTLRMFFEAADDNGNGTLQWVGVFTAVALGGLLYAPLDLAYDLGRIALVRHRDGGTFRAFVRAIVVVVRHPGLFVPLYAVFLALPLVLHGLYYVVRRPWTPSTAGALVILFVVQQFVMVVRAFLKIGFWGAEIACYEHLGSPRLGRRPERAVATVPALLPEDPPVS